MIILNETIIIDETINTEWLNWMKTVHIPAVLATGHFNSFQILHVLSSPNEGITYCVQYKADDMTQYDAYNAGHATTLKNNHFKQFENKFVQFESIMQLID
jgi:hypothetical protein